MQQLISNQANNILFKAFDSGSIYGIANEINEWVKTEPSIITIIDVVYSSCSRQSGTVTHSALVYYTKKERLNVGYT